MKLLLHTCCAPCSIYCIQTLQKEHIDITTYWYNPNIHPYMEYKNRLDTFISYMGQIQIPYIIEYDYGLRKFTKSVIGGLETRCQDFCYRKRLDKSAKYAKENGYDAFSTTLLVSPYQKHDMLKEICEEIGKKYNIEFVYKDFRVGFKEGQAKARELGLYMQKYCGCIYSEEISNYDRIISEQNVRLLENRITERKIRLGWDVPNLELKQHKSGNQNEIKFIYDLKKEVYQKYVEKVYGEWNEENQKKLFERFMKDNSKNIELIYLKDELVGFYNGKDKDEETYEIGNICIKQEHQNKGIGTAILKEIFFEHKKQNIKLQVIKINEKAIKLYEKVGFKKLNETETHYIMKKIS